MSKPGFWRRNRWGLLALLPVMALFTVAALDRTGYLQRRLDGQPRTGVSAAPADWVSYSGARLRLLNLVTTTDLYDADAKTVKLPVEVRAWKAVIEIQSDDQRHLAGCQLSLEDNGGRLFGTQPNELSSVTMPVPTCTAEDKLLSVYQVIIYFITPADAKPVAVRVIQQTALPAYARLLAN